MNLNRCRVDEVVRRGLCTSASASVTSRDVEICRFLMHCSHDAAWACPRPWCTARMMPPLLGRVQAAVHEGQDCRHAQRLVVSVRCKRSRQDREKPREQHAQPCWSSNVLQYANMVWYGVSVDRHLRRAGKRRTAWRREKGATAFTAVASLRAAQLLAWQQCSSLVRDPSQVKRD